MIRLPEPLLARLRDDGLHTLIIPGWERSEPGPARVHDFDHQVEITGVEKTTLAQVPDAALHDLGFRTARQVVGLYSEIWGMRFTLETKVTVVRWFVPDFEADLEVFDFGEEWT